MNEGGKILKMSLLHNFLFLKFAMILCTLECTGKYYFVT